MRYIVLSLALAACSGHARDVEHVPAPEEGPATDSEPIRPGSTGGDRIGERVPSPAPPAPLTPVPTYPPYPSPPAPAVSPPPTVNPGISEKWKAKVGLTTYRSTIHFFDGKVVVNSNGDGWKDQNDPLDGIHILDASSGASTLHISPPGTDEKDANGVALTKDFLVFGTDQDLLYKVDWTGSVLWQAQLAGDVEAAPALADFNGDTILDVAVGSEGGLFYTLNGKNGKTLKQVKATAGYYNSPAFVGAAALHDVTGDGVADIFVPSRDGQFRAIDGKKGKILWKHVGGSGMHGSPIVVDTDADGTMEVVFTESYSHVWCAHAKTGSIEWDIELTNPDGGIEGLFGPVGWYPDASCVLISTAWWASHEGVYCLSGSTGQILWRYDHYKRNISSGAAIGDIDGKPGEEAVVGTESGEVLALSSSGQVAWSQALGGPLECTPTIADIDADGLNEVLASANNGTLYAFDTPGKAPASIGYHRGSPHNTGVLP